MSLERHPSLRSSGALWHSPPMSFRPKNRIPIPLRIKQPVITARVKRYIMIAVPYILGSVCFLVEDTLLFFEQ